MSKGCEGGSGQKNESTEKGKLGDLEKCAFDV